MPSAKFELLQLWIVAFLVITREPTRPHNPGDNDPYFTALKTCYICYNKSLSSGVVSYLTLDVFYRCFLASKTNVYFLCFQVTPSQMKMISSLGSERSFPTKQQADHGHLKHFHSIGGSEENLGNRLPCHNFSFMGSSVDI